MALHRTARVGPVRCTGRKVGGGRKTVFTEGELRDLEGNLLATASAPVKVIDYPQASLQELQDRMAGDASHGSRPQAWRNTATARDGATASRRSSSSHAWSWLILR